MLEHWFPWARRARGRQSPPSCQRETRAWATPPADAPVEARREGSLPQLPWGWSRACSESGQDVRALPNPAWQLERTRKQRRPGLDMVCTAKRFVTHPLPTPPTTPDSDWMKYTEDKRIEGCAPKCPLPEGHHVQVTLVTTSVTVHFGQEMVKV